MVRGEFKSSFVKYLFCLFFILSGSFIAIRFSLWGIDEIRANHVSAVVFCFSFAVFGLLFGVLSIFVFQFNRKAFLNMENGKIDAQFGWGQELHAELGDITHAENHGKHLKLFVGGNVIWIHNLLNAKDLCEAILSGTAACAAPVNVKHAEERYRKSQKSFVAGLIDTVFVGAFLFVNIGWCVFFTEGKALNDLSPSEDMVFLAFVFAEIVTVIFSFFLADRCGKKLEVFRLCKLQVLSAYALEHKTDGLAPYPNILMRKYFDHYTYRIVVFAPKADVFAYMLERFDAKSRSWIPCYEVVRGFHILSELYDELEHAFADVMLEE